MNQTKLVSFVEAAISTLIGFLVSFLAWPAVATARDIEYGGADQLFIVSAFTALSIARGYIVRRWFNAELHIAAVNIGKKIRLFSLKLKG